MAKKNSTNDTDIDQDFDKAFDKEFEEEIRQLERETAGLPKIIVLVFLTVAVISLAIAAVSAASAIRTLSREEIAQGYVIDLVARRDQTGNEFYYPMVEYYLPDGSSKTVQLSEGSWPPAYEIGEAIIVAYDPDKPLKARIKSFESTMVMWVLPTITGVLGVAFLIAVFFAYWMLKPAPAEVAQEQSIDPE